MPSVLPEKFNQVRISQAADTYNILMVDVSQSMYNYWTNFVEAWNTHVMPILFGRTDLYVFSDQVILKRSVTSTMELQKSDFVGGCTNLTSALQTINREVETCKESYVNVFLITDGNHNASNDRPQTIIDKMEKVCGKMCNVFVLGVGNYFPVEFSINIRSRLHNGNSNLPSLFWAKTRLGIIEQIIDIAWHIAGVSSQCLTLSVSGSSLPGTDTKKLFYLNEWVYFPQHPKQLQQITLSSGRQSGYINLYPEPISLDMLLNEVFRQWNSVIIQLHNKKETIPPNVLPLMDCIFTALKTKHSDTVSLTPQQSIKQRLVRKQLTMYENEFRTLMNKLQVILTTEKFQNQLELADNILSTTVVGCNRKINNKVLRSKGHTNMDYKADCDSFLDVYYQHLSSLREIAIKPEDRCRITMASTISDLQDSNFPDMMQWMNKFEFLKNFTITGIPVYSPIRDSVTINPWAFSVSALVSAQYPILSQVALETFAETNPIGERNKDAQLKYDEQNTRFNAIVPVFSLESAKVMAPFIQTRLYAMCTTFAILKNPHIVDFNVHMAALGVTWARILYDYPNVPRPEYICKRIEYIKATAALYINRPCYAKYYKVLIDDPTQALMTESTDNQLNLKCETLVKPMFILHMNRTLQTETLQNDQSRIGRIMKMMIIEYIGRCLSKKMRENKPQPFTAFFAETLANEEQKKKWVQNSIAEVFDELELNENLNLDDYYTLEKVQKAAKKIAKAKQNILIERVLNNIPIALKVKKIEQLRNVPSAGDISLATLKTFAKDMGLTEAIVIDLFSQENMFIYTAHALQYGTSRMRLSTPLADYNTSKFTVAKIVQQEYLHRLSTTLYDELFQNLQKMWLQAYATAHKEMVQPMTRNQIIAEACQRGIVVTDATFNQVYKKYRSDVGLMGNACQCRACPHFLKPNKSYNQHASVERLNQPGVFLHGCHRVVHLHQDDDIKTIITQIASGIYSKYKTPVPRETVISVTDDLLILKYYYNREKNNRGMKEC